MWQLESMWEVSLDNYDGLTCQNHWTMDRVIWGIAITCLTWFPSSSVVLLLCKLLFFNLLIWNQLEPNLEGMFIGRSSKKLFLFFFYVDRKYSKETRGPKMIKKVVSVFNLCLWNQLTNWNQTGTKPKNDKRPEGVKKCVVCYCMWSFIFKPLLMGWFFLYVPY